MVTLISSKIEAENFTCCNWTNRAERVVYTDERFIIVRSSWFRMFCCSCCERVETNARTWEALKRSIRQTFGEDILEHCFSDEEVQRLMTLRRSVTTDIFNRIVNVAQTLDQGIASTTVPEEGSVK